MFMTPAPTGSTCPSTELPLASVCMSIESENNLMLHHDTSNILVKPGVELVFHATSSGMLQSKHYYFDNS